VSNRLIEDRTVAWTDADRAAINRARELARLGAGRTGSNPIVGAVVVRDGREVATGFHREHGDSHAEVVALDRAGEGARGATLYVTLEPCAHHGRTPPCVDRIIRSGVARVVCPSIDPDLRVRGRGVAALRANGVQVDVGCLAEPAILDNLAFFGDRLGIAETVTLKAAVSADGMVARARGKRDDVTSEAARRDGHVLRALHDTVVVGIETLLVDRPRLDCRLLPNGVDRDPVPVVLDTHARTPLDTVWSREGRGFVVVCSTDAETVRVDALARAGARILRAPVVEGGLEIRGVIRALESCGLERILIEGGPRVFQSFVDAGEWDALGLYRSPREFGESGVPLLTSREQKIPGRVVDDIAVGEDRRLGFVNESRWSSMIEALAAARS
jgi:diaminohydroxyphosphoribosylaminopyrimidine deaminase/5-amino-6-(5-phosphoribosylamino)uracil reductase